MPQASKAACPPPRLGSRPRGLVGLTPAEQVGRLAKAGDAPEGAALFRNKFPADAIGLQKIVPNERLAGINGNFNYVVTAEGKLIVGRSGHTSLAGGLDVRAAGEVQLYKGNIKWIDNMSGHYQPSGPGLSVVAERAFNDIGLNATGRFVTRRLP